MDAWFEEDEEVFVHARDPYRRVESLQTSREIVITLEDETIAQTTKAVLLLETGLPHRYYLPKKDVRLAFLRPSETVTRCPYKGEAHYYSLTIGNETYTDLAWYYRYPTPGLANLANYICFPQGKVECYVDGVLEPRPKSRWD